MRLKAIFLAMVMVMAAGPALAVGGVAAQPTTTDAQQSTAAVDADCEFPLEFEDATGETVTVDEEPDEIVILAPNVAQHVWEIGAEQKVTGMPVNQYTEYLEGSEERTHVLTEGEEGFDVPDTEVIVDLEPDLVLSPNVTPEDSVEELRDADQTVYHYPIASNFDDIMDLVEQTGALVGDCESGEEVTAEMAETIEIVETATEDVDEPRVFYDLGDDPSGPFTINDQAFEHQVLEIAGAENIAAEVGEEESGHYPEVSSEFVLGEDPEWIISPGEELSDFSGYDETAAFENGQILIVNANYISQHAPRTVWVLEAIAEELHPEAMEDAREEVTGDEEFDERDDVVIDSPDDEEEDDDADDSGPGLTAGAAVAALVALAVIATRRD